MFPRKINPDNEYSSSIFKLVSDKSKTESTFSGLNRVQKYSNLNKYKANVFIPENAIDDTDTFAVVSQDEIDYISNKNN